MPEQFAGWVSPIESTEWINTCRIHRSLPGIYKMWNAFSALDSHSIYQIQVSWQVQRIRETDFQELKWHTPKQCFPMCGFQTIGFLLTGLPHCQSCPMELTQASTEERSETYILHRLAVVHSWNLHCSGIVYVWTGPFDLVLSMMSRISNCLKCKEHLTTLLMSSI